jgi:hypothetical protein
MIPRSFKTAGGKTILVVTQNKIDYKDGQTIYGEYKDAADTIKIADIVEIDGVEYVQSEESKERTFLHELYHVFQFYSGKEYDEQQAQIFSNFMYEYLHNQK